MSSDGDGTCRRIDQAQAYPRITDLQSAAISQFAREPERCLWNLL